MNLIWHGHAVALGGKRFDVRAKPEEFADAQAELWLNHEIWATLKQAKQAFTGGHATYRDAYATLREIFKGQAEALQALLGTLEGIDSCFEPAGILAVTGPGDNIEPRVALAKQLIPEAVAALQRPVEPAEPPEGNGQPEEAPAAAGTEG